MINGRSTGCWIRGEVSCELEESALNVGLHLVKRGRACGCLRHVENQKGITMSRLRPEALRVIGRQKCRVNRDFPRVRKDLGSRSALARARVVVYIWYGARTAYLEL